MYRLTRNKQRQNAICKRMRAGKELKRMNAMQGVDIRRTAYSPPELRKVVIVIDYDIEPVIDVYRLGRAHRIDSYRISKNSEDAGHAGWANFCKRLSVHYPRLLNPKNLAD